MKDGGSRVARFLRGVPDGLVSEFVEKGLIDLFWSRFGLLQAVEVGFGGFEDFGEAFFLHGTDAVDVPGDEVHG